MNLRPVFLVPVLVTGAVVVGCGDLGDLPDRPPKPVVATMKIKVPGMT